MLLRTTVILDDALYARLARVSVEKYGNAKSLSRALNDLLYNAFSSEQAPESMFGAWKGEKRLSARGLREEGEPH